MTGERIRVFTIIGYAGGNDRWELRSGRVGDRRHNAHGGGELFRPRAVDSYLLPADFSGSKRFDYRGRSGRDFIAFDADADRSIAGDPLSAGILDRHDH